MTGDITVSIQALNRTQAIIEVPNDFIATKNKSSANRPLSISFTHTVSFRDWSLANLMNFIPFRNLAIVLQCTG